MDFPERKSFDIKIITACLPGICYTFGYPITDIRSPREVLYEEL
jgi:hypothetical protein